MFGCHSVFLVSSFDGVNPVMDSFTTNRLLFYARSENIGSAGSNLFMVSGDAQADQHLTELFLLG